MMDASCCLLSGEPGVARNRRTGGQLLAQYEQFFGLTLPPAIAAAYFQHTFVEFESERSGLRWFAPAIVSGAEFYEFLAASLPWYYDAGTWDKRHALATLRRLGSKSVFEAGCGGGALLGNARACGLHAAGSELNLAQVAALRKEGLEVFPAAALPEMCRADALMLIQVLEHVPQPVDFVRDLVARVRPRHLLIAVPGFETLLGRTRDPLVWPPHHVSIWSRRAFETLASVIAAKLVEVSYEPLDWPRFHAMVEHGLDRPIDGFPSAAHPRLQRLGYQVGRALKLPWALRAHTIFGVFEFQA